MKMVGGRAVLGCIASARLADARRASAQPAAVEPLVRCVEAGAGTVTSVLGARVADTSGQGHRAHGALILQRSAMAVLALLAAAGCIAPAAKTCSDGRVCPASKVCAPAGGCASPDEVQACLHSTEGAMCTVSAGSGRCRSGVCALGAGCGDGVVDVGEACDDGNTTSGDGCRGDCLKIEVCGDGIIDANEACDDHNTNPADGCDACGATRWVAKVLVGSASNGSALALPFDIAVDRRGDVYIADQQDNRVRKLELQSGQLTPIAGDGVAGFGGDGGAAGSAQLAAPSGVALDGLDNLFIADAGNNRIRRVDAATGIITTVAGSGCVGPPPGCTPGYGGDGGAATSALLNFPAGVAVDGLGNLYIDDMLNHRIRKVDVTTGVILTVAGGGATFGDDGLATDALLRSPGGIALLGLDRLILSDSGHHRIRAVDLHTGIISTVAGSGCTGGFGCTHGYAGDGGPATSADLPNPQGVAVDAAGNLYLADADAHRIRRIDASTGIITSVVGSTTYGLAGGYSGDGGPATSAELATPRAVRLDARGDLYIADSDNGRIRRVAPSSGLIGTVAGLGSAGLLGDGGAATSASVSGPVGVATDLFGNLFIAADFRIRRVDATTGVISTVAGDGGSDYTGDGGPAVAAQIGNPIGVALDAAGNVYISSDSPATVRRVDAATGVITTVAGDGSLGYSGDGGPASVAQLNGPHGLAFDQMGNLFIADAFNNRIRRVDAVTGIITTATGTTPSGYAGDGGLATSAQLHSPVAVVIDASGNLYFSDSENHCIRRVAAATGIITTVVGDGTYGFSGDGGPATAAQLRLPQGLSLDSLGLLYIVDGELIRRVNLATGIITTVAGSGFPDCSGDGGPAGSAQLDGATGLALDPMRRLLVADMTNDRIRQLDLVSGIMTTVAGQVEPEGMGPIAKARLADPRALLLSPAFTLLAGGTSGTVQAIRATTGRVEAVAGRYIQTAPTGSLARFRDQRFGVVGGVAYDATRGLIYLTETTAHRLHVVTLLDPADQDAWTIAPLAGDANAATAGYADGAVQMARFDQPTGLYLDDITQVLYVADTGNHLLRAIDLSVGPAAATVTTVAGTPRLPGFRGDDQPASGAQLQAPEAVTRCGNGDLFIADTGNHRVRRVALSTGVITTVLGTGFADSAGQGSPASSFPVDSPRGLACDALGNLYVTSRTTLRLLSADPGGVVDGSGQVLTIFGAPPRDSFPASSTSCLTGIAIVDDRTVQMTDSCTGLLIELGRRVLP